MFIRQIYEGAAEVVCKDEDDGHETIIYTGSYIDCKEFISELDEVGIGAEDFED